MTETGKKKRVVGVVTSNKMHKTVVVEVERLVRHKRYEKTIRVRRRFNAHDERNEAQVGDKVELVESRPLSKTKCWRVLQILRKAPAILDVTDEAEEAPEVVGAKEPAKKADVAPAGDQAKAEESGGSGTEESGDSKPDQT